MVCQCCGEEGWGFLFLHAPLKRYQSLVLASDQCYSPLMKTLPGREHNSLKILLKQNRKMILDLRVKVKDENFTHKKQTKKRSHSYYLCRASPWAETPQE